MRLGEYEYARERKTMRAPNISNSNRHLLFGARSSGQANVNKTNTRESSFVESERAREQGERMSAKARQGDGPMPVGA